MTMRELWIHPKKRRYYKCVIYSDLLGDRVLLRNWGSLDSKVGGSMSQLINTQDEEQHLLSSIRKRRLQHQYELVIDKI